MYCCNVSCITLWASHMYSRRGIQHIRNAFIIVFHPHFASDSCYTISYAFIPIHAFHTVHSSVHISSPSFTSSWLLCIRNQILMLFCLFVFLLFPDALYQKYVFLENIFCRDFVFIPGNTRKVSLLPVCFSLNPSPNFCVFVHACVHACMSVCVCTCLLYSINTKQS